MPPVLRFFWLLGALGKPGVHSLARKPAIPHVFLVRLPTFGSFWNYAVLLKPFRHICRAFRARAYSPVSSPELDFWCSSLRNKAVLWDLGDVSQHTDKGGPELC